MAATNTEEMQLRHVETDVLIPKLMREKAKELCDDKVQDTEKSCCLTCAPIDTLPVQKQTKNKPKLGETKAFNACCKESGFFMVFKCREENSALKACLTQYYKDPVFFEQCKQEYIQEKLDFERTGVPSKNRKQKLPTSM